MFGIWALHGSLADESHQLTSIQSWTQTATRGHFDLPDKFVSIAASVGTIPSRRSSIRHWTSSASCEGIVGNSMSESSALPRCPDATPTPSVSTNTTSCCNLRGFNSIPIRCRATPNHTSCRARLHVATSRGAGGPVCQCVVSAKQGSRIELNTVYLCPVTPLSVTEKDSSTFMIRC